MERVYAGTRGKGRERQCQGEEEDTDHMSLSNFHLDLSIAAGFKSVDIIKSPEVLR